MKRCMRGGMNEGDSIIFGKYTTEGYLEYRGYVEKDHRTHLHLTHVDGVGGYDDEDFVKDADDADGGEDFWRVDNDPFEFNDQRPLHGQRVWVSIAQEGRNSRIFRGLILGSPDATASTGNEPLRIRYYDTRRNRNRTKTLIPQAHATACDDFWAVTEPAPTYCDED